jgi:hypothetical protein
MNKKQRRELEALAREDVCTICGKQFPHLSTNYGGLDKSGKVALVGECCVAQMRDIHMGGIYMHPAWIRMPGEVIN